MKLKTIAGGVALLLAFGIVGAVSAGASLLLMIPAGVLQIICAVCLTTSTR